MVCQCSVTYPFPSMLLLFALLCFSLVFIILFFSSIPTTSHRLTACACGKKLPCLPASMHFCLSVDLSSDMRPDNNMMCASMFFLFILQMQFCVHYGWVGCVTQIMSRFFLPIILCYKIFERKGCLGYYCYHLCMLYECLAVCLLKKMEVPVVLMLQLTLSLHYLFNSQHKDSKVTGLQFISRKRLEVSSFCT